MVAFFACLEIVNCEDEGDLEMPSGLAKDGVRLFT
jgi:hypothetical protein